MAADGNAAAWITGVLGVIGTVVGPVITYRLSRPPKLLPPDTPTLDVPEHHTPAENVIYFDSNELFEKSEELLIILKRFQFIPSLIVGVSRMGGIVAAQLSKQIGGSPTVRIMTLWPRPTFRNALNITRLDFGSKDKKYNVLIVDDICRRGETLSEAKGYMKSISINGNIEIRTAAIWVYTDVTDQILPDFFVKETKVILGDAGGDVEER
jgi:hypoxanthine phosphoribosyltransferase